MDAKELWRACKLRPRNTGVVAGVGSKGLTVRLSGKDPGRRARLPAHRTAQRLSLLLCKALGQLLTRGWHKACPCLWPPGRALMPRAWLCPLGPTQRGLPLAPRRGSLPVAFAPPSTSGGSASDWPPSGTAFLPATSAAPPPPPPPPGKAETRREGKEGGRSGGGEKEKGEHSEHKLTRDSTPGSCENFPTNSPEEREGRSVPRNPGERADLEQTSNKSPGKGGRAEHEGRIGHPWHGRESHPTPQERPALLLSSSRLPSPADPSPARTPSPWAHCCGQTRPEHHPGQAQLCLS